MQCLIPHKHTLKILCKSKHFPLRYKRKRPCFFSEDSAVAAVGDGGGSNSSITPVM